MLADTATASDDVRERILKSATDLFSSKGYAATSIREIAALAHTTKPMIYYYFGSKEGLYTSIVNSEFTSLATALEEALEGAISLEDGLRRYITTYYRFFLSRGRAMAMLYKEMFGLGESLLADISATYFSRIRNSLANLFRMEKSLAGSPVDEETCSLAVLGILNMFLLGRLLGGQRFEIRPVIDQVLKIYLPGLMRQYRHSRT